MEIIEQNTGVTFAALIKSVAEPPLPDNNYILSGGQKRCTVVCGDKIKTIWVKGKIYFALSWLRLTTNRTDVLSLPQTKTEHYGNNHP